jgi:hypothetical protein
MLMVIAGAGASYDSIPSRPPGYGGNETLRLPLADALFESRGHFEDIQREIPQVMPIAPVLQSRRGGASVEDLLAHFASQAAAYPDRQVQLAAVRFYLQALIAGCEEGWYRSTQLPTNMMVLLDQIESYRAGRARPIFVTFNYDRLIENALENRGQSFSSLADYCYSDRTNVFKLHGSVNWVRPLARLDAAEFGGSVWDIARQVTNRIAEFPKPGDIVPWAAIPGSRTRDMLAVPAIAIPLKGKDAFECPDAHIEALRSALPGVRTIVTIGWRGAEAHFLKLLSDHCRQAIEVICVAGTVTEAQEPIAHLNGALSRAHCVGVGGGFTRFVLDFGLERLLNITWQSS